MHALLEFEPFTIDLVATDVKNNAKGCLLALPWEASPSVISAQIGINRCPAHSGPMIERD